MLDDEKFETSSEPTSCCRENIISDDPQEAALALEISARGIKNRLERSPPLPTDPLGKQIRDARDAAQMETDAKLAFMIRQSGIQN